MKKLTWRLSKLPTPDEVRELVKDKILTQEEAREILFKEEEKDKDRDIDSYKDEIKFLREMIDKLSASNRQSIIEYIYLKPYSYPWYQPYVTWCSSGAVNTANYINQAQCMSNLDCGITQSQSLGGVSGDCSFNSIQTF